MWARCCRNRPYKKHEQQQTYANRDHHTSSEDSHGKLKVTSITTASGTVFRMIADLSRAVQTDSTRNGFNYVVKTLRLITPLQTVGPSAVVASGNLHWLPDRGHFARRQFSTLFYSRETIHQKTGGTGSVLSRLNKVSAVATKIRMQLGGLRTEESG